MNTKAEPLEDQRNDKINLGLGLPYRSITFHHYVRESSLLCWSYFCLFLELLPHGKAGWGWGGREHIQVSRMLQAPILPPSHSTLLPESVSVI